MPKKVAFRLTAVAIRKRTKPGLIADGGNLYLQVTESGTKSWVFRYRFGGRNRAHGLGSVDVLSLERARAEALRCRQLLREGRDPIEERKARVGAAIASQAASRTFKECAELFVAANEAAWKNAKHAAQWRTTLDTYAYPTLGAIPVANVQTAHVLAVLEPIWKKKPETASRLRGRIEQVLDFAKARQLRTGENPATWRGHLDHVLPARSAVKPVRHHDAMPYEAVPAFYARLVEQEGAAPIALRWLILTCCRTTEAIESTWDEMDLQRGVWTVPPERMKAGREWRVPLSEEARMILAGLDASTAYVFPGRGVDRPLSNMAMLQHMRRMKVGGVPHGFRSSFRDWCAETQTVPHEVAEMALAHAVGSKVELAYRRSDMVEKRRELAQAWADFVVAKKAKQQAKA
jgi:integrase